MILSNDFIHQVQDKAEFMDGSELVFRTHWLIYFLPEVLRFSEI